MNVRVYQINCPHCGRVYRIKLDREKLATNSRQVICGRCRKRFSITQHN